MTTIHKSTQQSSTADPESPQQETHSPDPTTANDTESTVDSTHQSTSPTHEKSDQQLEATDPDISTADASSSTVDQVKDAVGTPINSEIQEEEPLTTGSEEGGSLAVHSSREDDSNPEDKVHSIQLAGRSKKQHSVTGLDHTFDHDQGSSPKDGESNTAETNRHDRNQHSTSSSSLSHSSSVDKEHHGEGGLMQAEELDSTKHAKRMVDDQARERHDYLAGAYKSPFRHAHKVEKVGREEL
ncbi:hypothetical protein BGX29_002597 [Mortierella sp. GBA35]|nr:hypothetical protein BGX29_002597 [Mortierella sp. GBA35]